MTRTPPSETSDPDANSRRARLAARRSRRTRVTVTAVVIVLAGAAAAGAYAYSTHDPQAHAASPDAPDAGQLRQGRDARARRGRRRPTPPRTLDHAHPLKLWIGGDSLAGSFGPALGDQVGATGVVKTVIDYRVVERAVEQRHPQLVPSARPSRWRPTTPTPSCSSSAPTTRRSSTRSTATATACPTGRPSTG